LTDFDSDVATFQTSNTQPVGIYLSDRANVLDVCNQLAGSIGARITASMDGKVSLVKLSLPQASEGITVTPADIVERSLFISQMPVVKAGVKIGYCKNWTVQTNLQTGIPEIHKDLFKQEWLTITRTDSVAAQNYNLYTEPEMEETLLLTASDATAEANRRLGIFDVQRKVMKYTGFYHLIFEKVGNPQTIQHSRFGLSEGITGQIISMTVDWIQPYVEIEVLI
jgi:hypothetical protein